MRSFRATYGEKGEGDSKPKTVLELLKPYPPPGAKKEEEEADGDQDEQGDERVAMVAERGLDWQVINLLLQAGWLLSSLPEGVQCLLDLARYMF